jgi:hypothetical protein
MILAQGGSMNTRWLMRASAIYLGLLGIAATFAPQEILRFAGAEATPILTLILQGAAAALLGIAMTNWMAQGVLIGGIYARPLALGNFAHFLISALALIKAVSTIPSPIPVACAAVIHGGLALLFARVAFGKPAIANPATGSADR